MKRPTAILYTSQTGFTARYAGMLARAAMIPAYNLRDRKELPAPGAAVIYLGWLCAGTIKGLREARCRWDVRAVCAVGLSPAEPDPVPALAAGNRLGAIPLFYLRGGYAPDRLPGKYRLMMAPMLHSAARSKQPEQQAMHATFLQGGDFVSEEALGQVLTWMEFHT